MQDMVGMALASHDPLFLLRELDKADAEESFFEFVKQAWHVVEPSPFVENWHIRFICEHLQALSDRDIERLLVNIPPRCTKSTLISVLFPVWCWIRKWDKSRRPTKPCTEKFLTLSYVMKLSIRDSLKSRRLIQSKWFQENWGQDIVLQSDQNAKSNYENTEGGYRIASSTDAAITGDGGDTILYDDPHNVAEGESEAIREATVEFFSEALQSRFNDANTGVLGVIMQRVHEKDVSGHILDEMGEDYVHIMLPMRFETERKCVTFLGEDPRTEEGELLDKVRFNDKATTRLENALGSYGTAGQLQQRPSPRGGGLFKKDWFEEVDEPEGRPATIRYWDLAGTEYIKGKNKPDWTVGTLLSRVKGKYIVRNVIRFRKSPGATKQHILDVAEADGKSVHIGLPIDPGQAGKAQSHDYVDALEGYAVHLVREQGDKVTRATTVAVQAETSKFQYVKSPWNKVWFEELTTFPKSEFKDQTDSLSGAYTAILEIEEDWEPDEEYDAVSSKSNDFSGL